MWFDLNIMGSWPLLVVVEREISYAVHAHHGGEDTYYSPMTAASAGTPSVWTAWLWPAVSSRLPRHGGGTPGVTSSHAPPRLGLGRHWLWVGLGWLPWAGGLGLVPTGRPQEAAAQEIEGRPAKHLALEHFQPVDVPLDRAGTPGQGDAGFDRLIVLAEPARKALQGLERTGSRALQPGIEALRLALAHEVGKVLREVDRLSHRGMLLPELGELLRFGRGALGLTPQHQPRRPARRQGLGDRLRHHRQALAPALAAGWDALGLTDAADIRGNATIAPGVAPQLEFPKQLDGGVAAGIPALQEIVLIGIDDTASIVAPVLPPGPRRHLHIALNGTPAAAHLGGDGCRAPALAVQGPHLIIARLPAGSALGCPGLLGWGRGRRRHRDGDRAVRLWHRLLPQRGIDGLQGAVMRGEDGLQGFRQVLQQMEAVRHLGGRGRALACPLSIRARPVPRDHLDPRVLPEPLGEGL